MAELTVSPLATGDELPVDAARAAIAAALVPITQTETLPLTAALGRILAADVVSPIDVPAHDNSAMDGYALHGADLATDGPTVLLALPGTVYAGAPWAGDVPRGHCLKIMTGAVMPAGLDTVVPRELVTLEGELVQIRPGALKTGENRRKQGEDLARGSAALRAGRRLRPADLGLLASLGLAEVTVFRRLRVALFSTGDEVFAPGQPLPPGGIYDSNRFTLTAALQQIGVEVLDLGLVRDDPATLTAVLQRALREADAVVTSGGVSMGDADHTRDVMAALGDVAFWKVAMRPGRPFAFGPLQDGTHRAMLFALPGNPVAALVTFYAFAREALQVLGGARPEPMPVLQARSVAAIRKRPGRTEYQRGIVERAPDGLWQVRITGSQGAGILRSLSEANALVVLRHEQGSVAAGEPVDVWLFDGLV
ncbi:MAG: molybdopterin molybdotransferase MoeA [Rubrivivax sp.]|nr:molybdopterin molybdotransferase MoeA [Rubrivivax sp.]